MQPTNNARPVMDVTAPNRSPSSTSPLAERPAPALPVREAPARPEDQNPSGPQSAATTAVPTPAPRQENTAPTPADAPTDRRPASQPVDSKTVPKTSHPTSNASLVPVGAIVATIFAMLVLSALAVLIYLNPN